MNHWILLEEVKVFRKMVTCILSFEGFSGFTRQTKPRCSLLAEATAPIKTQSKKHHTFPPSFFPFTYIYWVPMRGEYHSRPQRYSTTQEWQISWHRVTYLLVLEWHVICWDQHVLKICLGAPLSHEIFHKNVQEMLHCEYSLLKEIYQCNL